MVNDSFSDDFSVAVGGGMGVGEMGKGRDRVATLMASQGKTSMKNDGDDVMEVIAVVAMMFVAT